MPKLYTDEPDKFWKVGDKEYRIEKENADCVYSDEEHVYIDKKDNSKYISVTTLINKYSEEFDEDFWSSYKALEEIMDGDTFSILKKALLATKKFNPKVLKKFQIDEELFANKKAEIVAQYNATKNEACEHGTAEHLRKELSFYGKHDFDFGRYGYKDLSGEYDCKKNYYELDLERGVYPEFLIAVTSRDGILKVSGQIDCLIKNGNEITILDWKGLDINTLIPTPKGFVKMKDLKENDIVYDKDGNETKILHKSEVHYNPCYKITFDNNDSIIADIDHRWLVKRGANREKVMTTKEIKQYIDDHSAKRTTETIFKIYNPKPIVVKKHNLPLDPYVLGAWLGDGVSACGSLTQSSDSKIWEEISRRGYTFGKNHVHDPKRAGTDSRTIFNIRGILDKLNLLNNKHIPQEYLFASYEDRLDLLRGLMDTDGSYNKLRKRYVMGTSFEWQAESMCQLLSTFGIKPTKLPVIKHCNGKSFPGWDVCFTTTLFNPFLIRNQDINVDVKKDNNTFRNIVSVEEIESVPTQCIEVDSPTHTYLCTERFIVTHNTNREIKKESYYNRSTKQHQMMKFPLNNIQDSNYWHYALQLSLYAYLLQILHPEFVIKGLKLIHIDREQKETEYEVPYLKDDVERMLKHYKKQLKIEQELNKIKPVIK